MKKRDLIKTIAAMAAAANVTWEFRRHGAGHDIWSLNGVMITIPRHNEVPPSTTRKILSEAEAAIARK